MALRLMSNLLPQAGEANEYIAQGGNKIVTQTMDQHVELVDLQTEAINALYCLQMAGVQGALDCVKEAMRQITHAITLSINSEDPDELDTSTDELEGMLQSGLNLLKYVAPYIGSTLVNDGTVPVLGDVLEKKIDSEDILEGATSTLADCVIDSNAVEKMVDRKIPTIILSLLSLHPSFAEFAVQALRFLKAIMEYDEVKAALIEAGLQEVIETLNLYNQDNESITCGFRLERDAEVGGV